MPSCQESLAGHVHCSSCVLYRKKPKMAGLKKYKLCNIRSENWGPRKNVSMQLGVLDWRVFTKAAWGLPLYWDVKKAQEWSSPNLRRSGAPSAHSLLYLLVRQWCMPGKPVADSGGSWVNCVLNLNFFLFSTKHNFVSFEFIETTVGTSNYFETIQKFCILPINLKLKRILHCLLKYSKVSNTCRLIRNLILITVVCSCTEVFMPNTKLLAWAGNLNVGFCPAFLLFFTVEIYVHTAGDSFCTYWFDTSELLYKDLFLQ